MAVFTREQLKQKMQESDSDSKHGGEREGMIPDIPNFRVDIRHEIYTAVANSERAVNRAEIANLIDRKKST